MHKTMTSPAQPSNTVQHPLIMPPLLYGLVMHAPRNEMVIREWDPIALADFAGLGARAYPNWRWACYGWDVLG